MRVANLYGAEFDRECDLLAEKVLRSFVPEAVIGILTGGAYVGRRVFSKVKRKNPCALYDELMIQRNSSRIKKRVSTEKWLSLLPEPVLNLLRILEVHLLALKAGIVKPERCCSIVLSAELECFLQEGRRKILIVDDCIDTGATMESALRYFQDGKYAAHQIKVAVITVAHLKPLVRPDFVLHNRVLFRFPWSLDAKKD
jgi:uncharacterized protein